MSDSIIIDFFIALCLTTLIKVNTVCRVNETWANRIALFSEMSQEMYHSRFFFWPRQLLWTTCKRQMWTNCLGNL